MSNNQNQNSLIPIPQVLDGNPVNTQNQSINPPNPPDTNVNTPVNSILPVSLESPNVHTHTNLTPPSDVLQQPVVNHNILPTTTVAPLPNQHVQDNPTTSTQAVSNVNKSTQPPIVTQLTQPETTVTSNRSDPIHSVLVHHSNDAYYVLKRFCIPVGTNEPFNDINSCKHGVKGCLIRKSKVDIPSNSVEQLSPTVYTPLPGRLKKFKYNLLDRRMLKCIQPNCYNKVTCSPKLFHFSCYLHAINHNVKDNMHVIEYMGESDKILDMIDATEDEREELKTLSKQDETVILFPTCGKRCFSYLLDFRTKSPSEKTQSATPYNWNKDGVPGSVRSSTEILIDWMTTEENITKYYGGLDKNGKTNADRRHHYHLVIKDMIQSENSKYFLILIFFRSNHTYICLTLFFM
jgi:hypothetical protein